MTDTLDDGGGLSLEAVLGFGAKIGDLTSELREANKIAKQLRTLPVVVRPTAAGIFPASGNLALDLGGPSSGFRWLMRRLIITGGNPPTWAAAPAGSAQVFMTNLTPSFIAANVPGDQIVDEMANFTTNVNKAFYSNEQIVVTGRANEHLIVVILGGSSGTAYVAAGGAIQIETTETVRE